MDTTGCIQRNIYWPPKFVGSSDPRVIFASQGIEYRLQSPEKHNKMTELPFTLLPSVVKNYINISTHQLKRF